MATKIKGASMGDPAVETSRNYEAAAERLTVFERRVSRGRALTDPNLSMVELSPPATEMERLEAVAYLPQWERDWAEARLAAMKAADEHARMCAQLKQTKLDALRPEKRQAIATLARTLRAARNATDRLREVEELEETIAGPQAERLSAAWAAVIGTGNAHHEPHLDYWLRYIQAQGYEVGGTE